MIKAFWKLSPRSLWHTNLIFNHNSFRCWTLIQWSQHRQLMLFKILYSIIICCNNCHNYLLYSLSYLHRMDLLAWTHQILVNLVSKPKLSNLLLQLLKIESRQPEVYRELFNLSWCGCTVLDFVSQYTWPAVISNTTEHSFLQRWQIWQTKQDTSSHLDQQC